MKAEEKAVLERGKKSVLLISDMPSFGKAALSVMLPVLSDMKIKAAALPTALASNTLNYGKFHILDTTEYMEKTFRVWEELGFSFDAVATGFMTGKRQAALTAEYCRRQSKKGTLILCDPIMADNGRYYNGMSESTAKSMRELIRGADYIVPNLTEAVFLTGEEYKEDMGEEDIRRVIEKLRRLGAKSVVITSVCRAGRYSIACRDGCSGRYFEAPYEHIPVCFAGTGDMFSAVMLGNLLKKKSLEESVRRAAQKVGGLIKERVKEGL